MREDPPLEVTVATVVAERQASAGARDGVKGKRNGLAARAPLHALVRRRPLGQRRKTALAADLSDHLAPLLVVLLVVLLSLVEQCSNEDLSRERFAAGTGSIEFGFDGADNIELKVTADHNRAVLPEIRTRCDVMRPEEPQYGVESGLGWPKPELDDFGVTG